MIATQDIQSLIEGRHGNPHQFLGCHQDGEQWHVRAWLPSAETASVEGGIALTRIEGSDLFVATLTEKQKNNLPLHYRLSWIDKHHNEQNALSCYSFLPGLGEVDFHLFGEGTHWNIYDVLGAHVRTLDGIKGTQFCVWAPSAVSVAVVGDFNEWHGLRHPMRNIGNGIWEIFIPEIEQNHLYKYEIRNQQGHVATKTDPYAKAMEVRPQTASIIYETSHLWQDANWMTAREGFDWHAEPMNIYEVHLGSWQRADDGEFLNYREIAHRLVEYVQWMGYTHIELLPISEHPLDQSWGYQTTGYFAPTSRFGSPDDFRYFVDYCHQHNIGVFLDWVPAHFPKDQFALARFDGSALYEHEDPRQGEHQDWGTYIFNFGRNEVRNFLIANALYWLKEFHLDGLRVDAVASMLYLDYSREEGQWVPNKHGGRENLEAIEFMQSLNHEVHSQCPGIVMMAEESTSWPMVSRPTWMGGLGFSMKWNMGWMNDSLGYFEKDSIFRPYHHNELTFSQMYAYSENFVLPLSHDEVVHLKKSLVEKMPGDLWQRMANLRLLLAYQLLNPGKKLLFMGGEFAQFSEWNESASLDWSLCEAPANRGVQLLVRDLNHLYKDQPALHEFDFEAKGFEWIDCHDYQQSVLSFMRKGQQETLICVFNFTPVPRGNYRIGLPEAGQYQELINSDSSTYGGSNLGNGGAITTDELSWMNQPVSAELTLPPLGVVVLKKMTD